LRGGKQLYSSLNPQFPKLQRSNIQELSPSVHWAQEHLRESDTFHISRRIYDFELLYIQKGLVQCVITNQMNSLLLRNGDLILIPAGVHHELKIISGESANFLGIHFDFFDELTIANDEDIIVNEDTAVDTNFCALPVIEDWGGMMPFQLNRPSPQTISLIETVINEFSQKRLGYELICKGAMLSIISLLYRGQLQSSEPIPNAYADSLQTIFQQIEDDCAADWSNTKLGLLLDVHEDYMARLFKNSIGMSPNKYVQWVRHQKAKQWLREGKMKINSISHNIGYADAAYFCRVFKKYEGMSPEQYRRYSRIL
jgi:AraC-like DNA-binding protein